VEMFFHFDLGNNSCRTRRLRARQNSMGLPSSAEAPRLKYKPPQPRG
jgi:hypothetical protein